MLSDTASEALLGLLRAASAGRDVVEVIDGIGDRLGPILPFDRLSVIVPEPGSEIIVSHAFTTDSVGARLRLPIADTSAPRALAGECFVFDLEGSPFASERAIAAELGLLAAIYAPLVSREEVIGLLAISSRRRDAYDEHQCSLAAEVGRLLGPVVDNAALVARAETADDLRRRLRAAEASHRRLLSGLTELSWVVDPDGDSGQPLQLIVADVRDSLWRLEMPDEDDVRVVEAIADLARPAGPGRPLVTVGLDGDEPAPIDSRCGTALVRIAREAVANAVVHAGARRIAVDVRFGPDVIELSVVDDGGGFEPGAAPTGGGIDAMSRWAQRVGGDVEVRSAPGVGTKVVAHVGYEATEARGRNQVRPFGPETATVTVVVADRHEVVRRGLAQMLSTFGGLTVVGTVESAADLQRVIDEGQPSVVLLDLELPGASPLLLLEGLARSAVIMTSDYDKDERLLDWFRGGAAGHVARHGSAAELAQAVTIAAAGEPLIPTVVTRRLIEGMDPAGVEELTTRERDVLRELATGATNRAIGDRLFIGTGTVKFHVANLLRKLGAANRTEAVTAARARHLLD